MMRAFDTLLTRTVLVSLFGITLMHVLSLWSYEAARDQAAESAHGFGHGMLLSTIVMAAGIVVLSILIARWLTRPIGKMAAAVRVLQPGNVRDRGSGCGLPRRTGA